MKLPRTSDEILVTAVVTIAVELAIIIFAIIVGLIFPAPASL